MNTHTDKAQESKSKSISNGMSQTQSDGKSTFQFVDNRPESVVQRKLQDLADNSPQVSQLKTFQDMANNSPKAKQSAQLQSMTENHSAHQKQPIQKKENKTGLPDELKTGIENLSGYSMDDVKVHYNSDKPAQLQAHAYAQGTDIYLGSGQEKHLPHEAWHVVQQKQGRVKPTVQMKGKVNVNDDVGLEKEADLMGEKAMQIKSKQEINSAPFDHNVVNSTTMSPVMQPKIYTVQRKITVDNSEYSAKELEAQLKAEGVEFKEGYEQVLVSLDAKDVKFDNMQNLITNLQLNGDKLKSYRDEAALAWDGYDWGPGTNEDSLHDLAYNVIVNAITDKNAIIEMSYDQMFRYTPETQIAYCLWECRHDKADDLALCLYTSYFYEPLNKYFRGQSMQDESTDFGKLILKTAEVLQKSYENVEASEIEDKRYKLELKSDWIDDEQESINFAAPTSTHPNLDGVKNMWEDVVRGTFGDYDNFALLTFEGTAKTKCPQKKYFPNEVEDLMKPDSTYKIIDRYSIQGEITNICEQITIRVFRLSNIENQDLQDIEKDRLNFEDVVPNRLHVLPEI